MGRGKRGEKEGGKKQRKAKEGSANGEYHRGEK